MEERVEQAANKDTMLMAWFKLNQNDEAARDYLYFNIPQHYVFEKSKCFWKSRLRGGDATIGPMYSVGMSANIEKYCLRLLLLHVQRATSFEALRTYDGHTSATF